jgi:PAS domain S-box-containing protein
MCVDRNGRIAIVNAQVSIIFGYSRAELIGAEIEMLLPEALRREHHRHREDFVRNPLTRTMGAGLPLSGRRRDGSAFPVEVSLAADRAGGDSLVIAAVRDVSEQRATAAALRENESRLRQLAESVDVVFALRQLDPPGYLYVSPGSRTVLGCEPEAIMANPDLLTQAVHPQDRERVERDYLPAVFAGRPAQSEHRILTAGGQVRWLHFSATPVPNPLGPAVRSVVTVEDVTDRVKAAHALRDAEAAARAANEAKNQFLSRMSHELRTPLNAVLGFGQLLQRQLADTEHSEAISYVLKGGRHLLDLINDVLDIARIESGDMSISSEPVPVASVVEETIQLMAPLAESAGVTLTIDVGSPDEYVLADRQRLRQILLNLLSNAIKYNHPGGHAWVGWETIGDHAILRVRDDGPGIRQELQSRLFTPFDRLGAELSGVDGTGIGLALTRSLAEMMGGSITVESALGKGALVTVTMKSATAASLEIRADDGHSDAGAAVTDISPVTLLYIEDNAPNVLVVEHLIRLRPEWRLVHAALGSLGIELAEAHHPDLILLDLHLPDLSGREVLGALKRRPDLADTPVVILTADASAGQSRRLIDAGAAGYLTKPLDLDEVLEYLDNIARNKELPAAG